MGNCAIHVPISSEILIIQDGFLFLPCLLFGLIGGLTSAILIYILLGKMVGWIPRGSFLVGTLLFFAVSSGLEERFTIYILKNEPFRF